MRARLFLGLCAFLSVGAAERARAAEATIRDFMIMDVCLGPDGRVDPRHAPGQPGCARRRDVASGEALPYHLHDHPSANAGPCGRLGTLSKDNVPVVKDGVERIVSFYDHGIDPACAARRPDAPRFGVFDGGARDGGSLQWYDDAYGFIMGSWSPRAYSTWRTPACESAPDTSRRFFRGWIIGPRILPARGSAPGWGLFRSRLEHGDPAQTPPGCPASFAASLTTWVRADMTFRSGARLDALVSDHYSRGDPGGLSPGAAQQVERTYWTAEYGLTRWEKWAREDWDHPRDDRGVADLARAQARAAPCNAPYDLPETVTPGFATGPVQAGETVSETRTDTRSGESHTWYLTLCRDYTNIVMDTAPTVPDWGRAMSDAYWRE